MCDKLVAGKAVLGHRRIEEQLASGQSARV
jgi:hypothetical protein